MLRYTELSEGTGTIDLGYPVPLPLDTQAATDGFRAYDPLLARLQGLAVDSDDLRAQGIGTTIAGRTVWAFVAGDAGATTPSGALESAVVIDGTIHAREWASPEVVTGTIERLLEPEARPGLRRWLLDTQTIVFVPVLNVDGFLQTQRHPDRVLRTEYPEDPSDWPRDGRMQRKNMRDKDEILCAADDPACVVADGMNGVDANRNHEPWFGDSTTQSSGDPRSIVYRGTSAGSEAESQALYAAAALAPASRLRLYVDVHSYGRVFDGVYTGNARHDANEQRLSERLRAVTSNRYTYAPTPAGRGIGSTDEYFSYHFQVPSYTLEIEPGPNGAVEYHGFGQSHDGFVLPASEIARVRDELADTLLFGMYCAGGPPSVSRVEVRAASDDRMVFAGAWVAGSTTRRHFEVSTREALHAETDYRVRVVFDKPMRVRDDGANVIQYRGQSVALAPVLSVEGLDRNGHAFSQPIAAVASAWRAQPGAEGYGRYADDAISVGFRLPAGTPPDGARRVNFRISATDACGQPLDADPSTVADWSDGGWSGWENDQGQDTDTGGSDRAERVVDDGSPLFGDGSVSGSGGGGAFTLTALLVLLGAGALARRR